jgi:hypothetical protein
MEENLEQIALGRANAACAAIFALFDYFQKDERMGILFSAHSNSARAVLLNSMTPEIALSEFDRAIDEMRHRLPKIVPHL